MAWPGAAFAHGASALAWQAVRAWGWQSAELVEAAEPLGRIGSLEVRLATRRKDVRRAQRVRYKVFYEEGAAIPDRASALQRRDFCPFDKVCDHLIVIDHASQTRRMGVLRPKVVGTYRLLRQSVASRNFGFYTAQEFDIAPLLARHADKQFLELGRSCVLPDYRSKRTIELLWRGIWAYVQRHDIDVLLGCASFSGIEPAALALPLSYLQHHAGTTADWQAEPWRERAGRWSLLPREAVDRRAALAALPPLVKGYLRAGARFGSGVVVDRQFGTSDILAVMPLADLDQRYFAHFSTAS
jgi:putative hemolysin